MRFLKNGRLFLLTHIGIRVFWVADFKSKVKNINFKMADPRWLLKIKKLLNFDKNLYLGVSWVNDIESIIKFLKFKMAVPRWRLKIQKFVDVNLKLKIKNS